MISAKLISGYHFWANQEEGGRYSFQARRNTAFQDLKRLCLTPITFLGMQFTAIRGVFDPSDKTLIHYTTLEDFAYGNSLLLREDREYVENENEESIDYTDESSCNNKIIECFFNKESFRSLILKLSGKILENNEYMNKIRNNCKRNNITIIEAIILTASESTENNVFKEFYKYHKTNKIEGEDSNEIFNRHENYLKNWAKNSTDKA